MTVESAPVQRSIEVLKQRPSDCTPSSSAAEQRLMVHLIHALEFQLGQQTAGGLNGNGFASLSKPSSTSDDLSRLQARLASRHVTSITCETG